MDFDLSSFDHLHTQPNIFGGQDLFDSDGMICHTQPNIFGGEDFHSLDDQLHFSSRPNIFGGFDLDPLQSMNFNTFPDFTL